MVLFIVFLSEMGLESAPEARSTSPLLLPKTSYRLEYIDLNRGANSVRIAGPSLPLIFYIYFPCFNRIGFYRSYWNLEVVLQSILTLK